MSEKVVLAVETTASIGGVALVSSDKGILAEEFLEDGMKHGRLLLPAIDKTLKEAALELENLSAIAVSIGPGSYTGTRVGVIAAKTLAFAKGLNIIGVSSMAALALSSKCSCGLIVPMQFARNNEVYTGMYRLLEDGTCQQLRADLALEPELIGQMIGEEKVVSFIGSALERFADDLSYLQEMGAEFESDIKAPFASAVAWAGLLETAEMVEPLGVEPIYMRRDSSPCTFEKFQNN